MSIKKLEKEFEKEGPPLINSLGEIQKKEPEKVTFIPVSSRCKDKLRFREFYTLDRLKNLCHRVQDQFEWLDVCCGKMTLLNHVDKHLKAKCKKIAYTGFDFNIANLRDCAILIHEKKLKNKLARIDVKWGEIKEIRNIFKGKQYNFISLSNALHEIEPFYIAELLVDCLKLCAADGIFIIIDMQNLIEDEKYSVTWTDNEMERILKPLFSSWKEDLIVSSDLISSGKEYKVSIFLTEMKKTETLFHKKIPAKQIDKIINKINSKIKEILKEKRKYLDEEIRKHCREGNNEKDYLKKLDLYHTIDIYLKGYKNKENIRM